MSWLRSHRYLLARRMTQTGVLGLFWLGAHLHLGILTGNLSSSRLLRTVPLADPLAVLQILATRRPVATTALIGAGIVTAFYFTVGGRAFCGWVCPIDMIADLGRWMKRRFHVSGQFRVIRQARYTMLILLLAVSAVSGVAAFEWVSPIAMVHRELIFVPGLGLLAIGGILLLDLFVLRYGWCGSLCPLGAFYSIVGQRSLVRMRFDASRCDHCGECVPVCPEPQVIHFETMASKGMIDDGECLNCGRCLEVCPRGAYAFGLRFHGGAQEVPRNGRSEHATRSPGRVVGSGAAGASTRGGSGRVRQEGAGAR